MEKADAGANRTRQHLVSATLRHGRVVQRGLSISRWRRAEVATKCAQEYFVTSEAILQRDSTHPRVVRCQLRCCALQLQTQRELLQRFARDPLELAVQPKPRLAGTSRNRLQRDTAAQAPSDVAQQQQKGGRRRHGGWIVVQRQLRGLMFLARGRSVRSGPTRERASDPLGLQRRQSGQTWLWGASALAAARTTYPNVVKGTPKCSAVCASPASPEPYTAPMALRR